ncbi:lipopolysaccharide assembly protein LapA domain-containing protein [Paenibacillus sp. JX-17]|uniref:Lipopolysaccharide assembly protein LapA domain-containing protein n=1 Tax=Paenibacillus lacisoli TaxID=3064525 RepID=A0ABT9CE95_9BACL|nr:lipopolysaccharide assembly protein LapA domain-containing protein [Paenibacillus sp. JX-17]MDO7906026.1 lipopolysaccharide assembly protein LapA domain-containing protein [Paenibacillus sp. JX-17]
MKMQWSLIAALIFALLIAVFAVINVDPVQVNFMFSTVSVPLILLILSCALIGGLVVGAFGIYRQYRLQRQIKQLRTQLQQIQEATGYEPNHAAPSAGTAPVVDDRSVEWNSLESQESEQPLLQDTAMPNKNRGEQ